MASGHEHQKMDPLVAGHLPDSSNKGGSTYAQSMKTDHKNSKASNHELQGTFRPMEGGVHPAAASECYKEDYFLMWHQNHHGSIDLGLDEKLTSMTGSYSEILDDRRNEELESQILQASLQSTHENPIKAEGIRKSEMPLEEIQKQANSKVVKPPENQATNVQLSEEQEENSVAILTRDFSERSSISSQPSKRKECLIRNMSSSQNVPRSLLYPSIPPVDPSVIADLEDQARHIATSMDTLIENLTGTLHSISALSVECVETYRDAVCKTCDAVDSNIKSMYQLMAKCEELSKSMKPVYKLHDQIKEIRRLLDLFESSVYSGGT